MGGSVLPYYRHRSPIGVPDLAHLRAETVFAPENVDRLVHFLSLLGQDVEVTVRLAPRGQ